jgi:hypothetical protein
MKRDLLSNHVSTSQSSVNMSCNYAAYHKVLSHSWVRSCGRMPLLFIAPGSAPAASCRSRLMINKCDTDNNWCESSIYTHNQMFADERVTMLMSLIHVPNINLCPYSHTYPRRGNPCCGQGVLCFYFKSILQLGRIPPGVRPSLLNTIPQQCTRTSRFIMST